MQCVSGCWYCCDCCLCSGKVNISEDETTKLGSATTGSGNNKGNNSGLAVVALLFPIGFEWFSNCFVHQAAHRHVDMMLVIANTTRGQIWPASLKTNCWRSCFMCCFCLWLLVCLACFLYPFVFDRLARQRPSI